ncbi:hypothetical protein K502DRAFT_324833 [Neoconidiobolus thromboides FSU 785]|nr:hypothetical protein K502DRAFT_324833 [Neoconidiobolus thromboides FSU 785]
MSVNEESNLLNTQATQNSLKLSKAYYFIQINLAILLASIQYLIWKDGYNTFNLHPALMILCFYFTSQAILVLKVESSLKSKRLHQVFQTLAGLSFITSFIVIYTQKSSWGEAHFQSPHAILGLTILILFLSAGLVATLYHYKLISNFSVPLTKIFRIHRTAGYAILGLFTINIFFGLELGFSLHNLALAWVIYPSLFTNLVAYYSTVDRKKLIV